MLNLKTFPHLLLALAISASISSGAATLQSPSASSIAPDKFSGAWHWMFNGESFATLTLVYSESGYTGSLTGVQIELNDDGTLSKAEASGDAPQPVKRAWLDGSNLHITVMDGDEPMEWIVALKDDTHAEIRSAAMAAMKPIAAQKGH